MSCTLRPPGELDKNEDPARRGTTSDPVDSPGGSRECRLGGRVYLLRVSDLTRWRKRGRNSATYYDRKGMLLPPREEHLEVHILTDTKVHLYRTYILPVLLYGCETWTVNTRCLNVRSLLNKFDDIVELCHDRHIDLLCLTELWHDADSAILGRLRCSRYNVVNRPRPRTTGTDDMSVNHGGVVVMAAANVSLLPISVSDQPSTFEVVCIRAVVWQFSAIVVLVYRPGSAAVQQTFYDELATVLD